MFQKLISLCKKRIKLERSKKYLEICTKHSLWPHFTNIKVRDQAVKNKDETKRYRTFLLQNEIEKKSIDLDNTKQLISSLNLQIEENFVRNQITEKLKFQLNYHKNMILNNTNKAEEKRFANKLRALQNKQQFSNEKDSFDCYINLSNYELHWGTLKMLHLK